MDAPQEPLIWRAWREDGGEIDKGFDTEGPGVGEVAVHGACGALGPLGALETGGQGRTGDGDGETERGAGDDNVGVRHDAGAPYGQCDTQMYGGGKWFHSPAPAREEGEVGEGEPGNPREKPRRTGELLIGHG